MSKDEKASEKNSVFCFFLGNCAKAEKMDNEVEVTPTRSHHDPDSDLTVTADAIHTNYPKMGRITQSFQAVTWEPELRAI